MRPGRETPNKRIARVGSERTGCSARRGSRGRQALRKRASRVPGHAETAGVRAVFIVHRRPRRIVGPITLCHSWPPPSWCRVVARLRTPTRAFRLPRSSAAHAAACCPVRTRDPLQPGRGAGDHRAITARPAEAVARPSRVGRRRRSVCQCNGAAPPGPWGLVHRKLLVSLEVFSLAL